MRATEYVTLARNDSSTKPPLALHVKWHPPKQNHFKLNIDGAFKDGVGGIGGVFRNSKGDWVLGYYMQIPQSEYTYGELISLLHDLKLAYVHGLHPLVVDTYSIEIINMFITNPQQYTSILHDCRILRQQLGDPELKYYFREQNKVADLLAKE
nr:uncharacterized protein LOC104091358 [Nicotiana tomentosiformis]